MQPIVVPFTVWKRAVTMTALVLIPGCTLLAVVLLRDAGPGLTTALSLFLAGLGTSVQAARAMHSIGEEIASAPHPREAIIASTKADIIAWGLLATAAWAGLFAQLV